MKTAIHSAKNMITNGIQQLGSLLASGPDPYPGSPASHTNFEMELEILRARCML